METLNQDLNPTEHLLIETMALILIHDPDGLAFIRSALLAIEIAGHEYQLLPNQRSHSDMLH